MGVMFPNIYTLSELVTQATKMLEDTRTAYQAWSHTGTTPPMGSTSIEAHLALSELLTLAYPGLMQEARVWDADRRKDFLHQLIWRITWAELGLPVFELTHGLAAALLLTDSSGVKMSEQKWPFPAFQVLVPKGFFQMVDAHTGTVDPVTMLSCYECEVLAHPEDAPAMCTTLDELHAGTTQEARARTRERIRNFARVRLHNVWSLSEHGTTITKSNVILPDDADLAEYLGQDRPWADADMTEIDKNEAFASVRLVTNLVLYLNSLTTPPAPPRTIRRDSQGRPKAHVLPVGREVKLPRQLREAAVLYSSTGKAAAAGWRLQRRFVVRGHWSNQAYGPRWQQHRRIWIQPFWKGPTTDEAMRRVYAVDTEKPGS